MKHRLTQCQEDKKLPNKDFAKFLGLKGTNPTVTLLRWKNCQLNTGLMRVFLLAPAPNGTTLDGFPLALTES